MEHHSTIHFGIHSFYLYCVLAFLPNIFIMVIGLLTTRKKALETPTRLQSAVELIVEFLYNRAKSEFGEKLTPIVFPFLSSFFVYILIANLMALFPYSFPPTCDLSTTLSLSLIAIIGIQVLNIKVNGFKKTILKFFNPHPQIVGEGRGIKHILKIMAFSVLFVPLHIIDNIARTLSLSLRLFGNIDGEHIVFEQVNEIVPYLLPVILLLLALLVSIIQASVFSLLTMFYLKEEVGIHEKEHH